MGMVRAECATGISMAAPPTHWIRARDLWLEEVGRADEFRRRAVELMDVERDFGKRQEILDEEFGVTYELLEPYVRRWREGRDAAAAAKRAGKDAAKARDAGPSGGVPAPDPAVGGAGDGGPEAIGGDVADVRWAIANLSRQGVGPRDAPTAIAWNLLVIGRSGIQGQLKLMDIYRATIVQPAAKAAEQGPVDGPDVRLEDLLARLSEGLCGPEDSA